MLATTKQIRELKKELEELKNRIFVDHPMNAYSDLFREMNMGMYGVTFKERPLEEYLSNRIEKIMERQNLLLRHLGLAIMQVDATEKHEKIVSLKKPVEKKVKRGRGRPKKVLS